MNHCFCCIVVTDQPLALPTILRLLLDVYVFHFLFAFISVKFFIIIVGYGSKIEAHGEPVPLVLPYCVLRISAS